jgi:hypothetical protein
VTILAAGGILYLVFQKIEPQAKPAMHFAPPLGAVFGSPLGRHAGQDERTYIVASDSLLSR